VRLHSLRVTAFGPFADAQLVDFDSLGADGLFLLHGPTGAGKTTVLDAVAFGLFGELPGARGDKDGRRLLSDHAAAGTSPQVELELTVGGRRLRLVRTPEHQRPKRRGQGSVTEPARATLTWLDRVNDAPVTRIPEVAIEVHRLVGMSADQFFQVALLPQGEFARFLRSGTEERARLLARLFDTSRFDTAEKWLSERRRASTADAAAATQLVEVLLGRVCTAAGVDTDTPPVSEIGPWAQQLVAQAHGQVVRTAGAVTLAQQSAAAARDALIRARERVGLVDRRERAGSQLADLEAQRARHDQLTCALRAAQAAAPAALAARDAAGCAVAASEHRGTATELAERVASDPDGRVALARAGAGQHDLVAASDGWWTEVGRLDELIELACAVQQDEVRADRLRAQVQTVSAQLNDLAGKTAELPAARVAAESALIEARRAADGLAGLQTARRRAAEVAAAAAMVPSLRATAADAEAARSLAVTRHQEAKQFWLDLREHRLAGIAAELAGALQAGQACAVCGSRQHPRPAQAGERAVSESDERLAHEAETVAAAAVTDWRGRCTAALRELDGALHRSTGLDPVAALQADVVAAEACERAAGQAAGLVVAERRCGELEAEAELLVQLQLQLHQQAAGSRVQLAELHNRIAGDHARLQAGRGFDPDVAARRARLHQLAAATADLLAARVRAHAAEVTAAQRHAQAQAAARQAGFTGAAQAQAAVLPAAEIAEMDAELAIAAATRSAALAVLAELEIVGLGAWDGPGAAAAECAEQERTRFAEQALGQAQGAAATAAQRWQSLEHLHAQLRQQLAVLGPMLAEAQRVTALAEVVSGLGQNSRRVSLHSYVLAARLEQVAHAASQRLHRMSAGRYELVHSDAVGPNGRRGGLGLEVLDAYTGAVRSTKTLSGGESFLASLSLALGLADVVAEESGGVALDTLFIDEGFGTLDPAALEEVMGVLDELRAGGRVVGLVSHVDELRQRIPNRLHVRMTQSGSSLHASTG